MLLEDWRGLPAEVNDSQSTALHLAARNGHHEVVKLLVACPVVVASQPDADGLTALDVCRQAQQGQWRLVEEVLIHPESEFENLGDAMSTKFVIVLLPHSRHTSVRARPRRQPLLGGGWGHEQPAQLSRAPA